MTTETLYGPWWVEVEFGDVNAEERFIISGSDASDGVYSRREYIAGIRSGPGMVTGKAWTIRTEFSAFAFLNIGQIGPFVQGAFYSSGIRRAASYTEADNLVVTLSATYTEQADYSQRPDFRHRAMTLTCKNLDATLTAGPPVLNRLSFTLPRETLAKYRHKLASQQRPVRLVKD